MATIFKLNKNNQLFTERWDPNWVMEPFSLRYLYFLILLTLPFISVSISLKPILSYFFYFSYFFTLLLFLNLSL